MSQNVNNRPITLKLRKITAYAPKPGQGRDKNAL